MHIWIVTAKHLVILVARIVFFFFYWSNENTVTIVEWLEFIEHFPNMTTNDYESLTELHTPNITVITAHIKSSQFVVSSAGVAWWRISTMSSASVIPFLPAGDCPQLTHCSTCPAYNILAWAAQKTSPLLLSFVALKTCLFAKPLLSNGSCIAASFTVVYLATCLHSTVLFIL
jgi:hypothetical protein